MMLSPGYSYDKAPDQKHFLGRARTRRLFPRHSVQPQEELAVQPVAAVSGIPDGQAPLRLHAVGHADVQHLWLAEAVLSAAGWLRRYVRGTDGQHGMGASTAPNPAIPSAPTAWCIAAMKRRP